MILRCLTMISNMIPIRKLLLFTDIPPENVLPATMKRIAASTRAQQAIRKQILPLRERAGIRSVLPSIRFCSPLTDRGIASPDSGISVMQPPERRAQTPLLPTVPVFSPLSVIPSQIL